MKILVIGARSSGSKNDPRMIAAALEEAGHDVLSCTWESLRFDIRTGSVKVYDGSEEVFSRGVEKIIAFGWYKQGRQSIYRDVAFSFGLVAQSHNVSIWNSEVLQQRSTSKLSCMVQLALANIEVPPTQFSLDAKALIERQPLPFIAKAAAASRGENNYLVDSEAVRKEVCANPDIYFLVQQFLANTHDLRVICFDGRPQLALRRSRDAGAATHLNNTSQGATAEWIELQQLPAELLTVAEKICKIMSREMAGIDFIPDTQAVGGYSCLEVNAVPQLTSGFDVDVKIKALTRALTSDRESEKI